MVYVRYAIFVILLCRSSTFCSELEWEQLSGPYGGCIRAQAIHSTGGHFALFDSELNLSTDEGTTWTSVFTDAIAFKIGLDELIYVQSDDGLYFSPDDGSSWNKLPSTLYNLDLNRMAISNEGLLFFADSTNLFVSQDRAISWTPIEFDFENSAHKVEIVDNGDLYVFGNDKVFTSSSSAEVWSKILDDGGIVQDVLVSFSDKLFVAVGDDNSGALLMSLNGGSDWQTTDLPYAKKLFESPQGWLLGTSSTVERPMNSSSFISLDGGASWSPIIVSGPTYNFAVTNDGRIFLGSDGFFESSNSGGTFQPIAPNRAHVYALASSSDDNLIAVTATDSSFWRFWRSNDDGESWGEIDKTKFFNNPDAFFECKSLNENHIWISLGYQTDTDDAIDKSVIYETVNGGLSWDIVREMNVEMVQFEYDKSINTCYVWAEAAKYFDRSEDLGETWEPIPTPFEFGEMFAAANGLVYGYSRGDKNIIRRIYYSFNSGEPDSWERIDVPYESGLAQLFVDHMGLLFKLVSEQEEGGYKLKRLYRSTDYGQSWTDIKPDSGYTTWSTVAPSAISFDYLGGIYLWSSGYILLSRNAGLDWDEIYSSSPSATDAQCFLAKTNGEVFAGFYASSVRRAEKQPYDFLFSTLDDLEYPVAQTFGVAWVDYDVDGLEDVFIANEGNNFLYKNLGKGAFKKIETGEIVTDNEPSRSASWADYNNDGFPDCYVTNWNAYNSLYKNLGDGTFKKITSGNIVEDFGGFRSCSWVDVNRDGHLDMYIANVSGKNILYINDGTNHFTKSNSGAIGMESDVTYGIGWCDFDADGDVDLYCANGGVDKLYEQVGNLVFEPVNESRLLQNDGVAVGCSWGDYDNDGWMDIFIANADQENFLLRNNGNGSFTRKYPNGLASDVGVSKGSSWADSDNDGDLDLFVTNNGSHFFYSNNGVDGFDKEAMKEFIYYGGNSLSVAWGDKDNDGDADLVLASYDLQTVQYENIQSTQNWLEVKCIGTMSLSDVNVKDKSNRSAIGARIRIRANIDGSSIWQTREISAQTGHAGQNSIVQHFGLGSAGIVDSLVVHWPSGKIQRLSKIGINQRISVRESDYTNVVEKIDLSLPGHFQLAGNYPNPFNPSTTINYSVPHTSKVVIQIFDTRGRLVRTLSQMKHEPGHFEISWDSLDTDGRSVASGIYFCLMTTDGFAVSKKMTLLR